MRSGLVLVILALMSASAFAQREGKFEVAAGIGTDLVYSTIPFTNHHNLSASVCYNLSNEWGVALYFGQQVYSVERLNSEHESFLGGRTPDVNKTVTSLLVGGRYFIPTESKVADLYISFALGSAKSVTSAEGYHVVNGMSGDTVYYRVQSGQFFQGLLSLGTQVHPLSFLNLFAELQMRAGSEQENYLEAIACRAGIGVVF
jgi:hypothetical protein